MVFHVTFHQEISCLSLGYWLKYYYIEFIAHEILAEMTGALGIRDNIRAVSFVSLGVTVFPERNIILGVTVSPGRKIM